MQFPIAALINFMKKGRRPSTSPLSWIEILSDDDCIIDVWDKANELLNHGVPNVGMINPNTLESKLRAPAGITHLDDKVLRRIARSRSPYSM
jgi:hypothetical protein